MTRARAPIQALTPLDEVVRELLARLEPVPPRRLPAAQALGRILAEPIVAGRTPPQPVARRAGWAVAAHDTAGASGYSPMPAAGAVPVEAGDPLPPGADAVLAPDGIEEGPPPMIFASAAPGEGARRAGEDLSEGATVRPAGEAVRPVDLFAALGDLACRAPGVVVLAGGRAAPGAAAFAAAWARRLGAQAEIADADAAPPADLVVAIGADDAGPWGDRLAAGGLIARGIALEPGRDSAVGVWERTAVVLLPGRAEEVFAGMAALVDPCLRLLAGAGPRRPDARGSLTRKVASALGRAELALLRRGDDGFDPVAVGDLTLAALGRADHWLLAPADSEGFAAGDAIEAFRLEAGL